MDTPYTSGSDPGYDTATGYGCIQADRALDEILGTSNTDIARVFPQQILSKVGMEAITKRSSQL